MILGLTRALKTHDLMLYIYIYIYFFFFLKIEIIFYSIRRKQIMLCYRITNFFGKNNLFLICLHEISPQEKKITSGLSVPNYPKTKKIK